MYYSASYFSLFRLFDGLHPFFHLNFCCITLFFVGYFVVSWLKAGGLFLMNRNVYFCLVLWHINSSRLFISRLYLY